MKILDLPDVTFSGENLDERPRILLDGYDVYSWTPERDGQGTPTEVHLVLEVPAVASLLMAFRSADAVDLLIAALTRHRNDVWGGGEG